MNKIELTKREKLLIYILSLTLLIFLYINFIRDSKVNEVNAYSNKVNVNQYNEMIDIKDNLINKMKSSDYIEENLSSRHKNFGQRLNTEKLIKDLDLNLKSISISQVQKENFKDVEVYYISSITNLEGTKENIVEYLKKLNEIEFLYIEDLAITRIDKVNHSMDLTLKEYTLLELPNSGVVRRSNFTTEEINNDSTLLDNLYGNLEENKESLEEEKEEIKSTVSNTKSSSKSIRNNTSKENKDSNTSIKEELELSKEENIETEEIFQKSKEDETSLNFRTIDEKKPITIGESYLRNYVEQWDINFVFNSNYFIDSKISEKLEFQEGFVINERNGEVILNVNGLLDLKDIEPIISKPEDLFAFEFETDLGSRIFLDFQDSSGNIYSVEAVKQYENWQNVEFGLPIESELYPVEIVSIRCLNKIGECNGQIKNFVFLSKK